MEKKEYKKRVGYSFHAIVSMVFIIISPSEMVFETGVAHGTRENAPIDTLSSRAQNA